MARNYLSGWVGGRVGGWIFWKYSQLSPQQKLGFRLGLSLAITKNDLHVVKRILYDTGRRTVVRWPHKRR